MGRRDVIEQVVPCNGCTECCRNDIVFLHPELGDKASTYQTRVVDGRYALAHQDGGACIYLGKRGCTIWDRRPAVCREFDCAILLSMSTETIFAMLQAGAIGLRHLHAARKRVEWEKSGRRAGRPQQTRRKHEAYKVDQAR